MTWPVRENRRRNIVYAVDYVSSSVSRILERFGASLNAVEVRERWYLSERFGGFFLASIYDDVHDHCVGLESF